jgi:hypothetical protein
MQMFLSGVKGPLRITGVQIPNIYATSGATVGTHRR